MHQILIRGDFNTESITIADCALQLVSGFSLERGASDMDFLGSPRRGICRIPLVTHSKCRHPTDHVYPIEWWPNDRRRLQEDINMTQLQANRIQHYISNDGEIDAHVNDVSVVNAVAIYIL